MNEDALKEIAEYRGDFLDWLALCKKVSSGIGFLEWTGSGVTVNPGVWLDNAPLVGAMQMNPLWKKHLRASVQVVVHEMRLKTNGPIPWEAAYRILMAGGRVRCRIWPENEFLVLHNDCFALCGYKIQSVKGITLREMSAGWEVLAYGPL